MSRIRLYRYGLEVFNYEKLKFKRWLLKSNISLGNKRPIDLVNINKGKLVYDCLIRIDYGNFC